MPHATALDLPGPHREVTGRHGVERPPEQAGGQPTGCSFTPPGTALHGADWPSLLHLRRSAVQAAQEALIACLRAETAASMEAAEADRAIARQLADACALDGDDAAVEALAATLPRSRERAACARARADAAQVRTACARAALTACRTAQDIAEIAMAERHGPAAGA